MSEGPNPKVFFSYSHDSAQHKRRVLELSNRLRTAGIDATIDQYVTSPAEGWPKWTADQIENDDYVLLICTETYLRRMQAKQEPGTGLGARWEGNLVYQHIYNAGATNTRFIPVVFTPGDVNNIPAVLRGATFYTLESSDGYEQLLRRVTNQAAISTPPVGNIPEIVTAPALHSGALGKYTPPLRVFLCHSSTDKLAVRDLYTRLAEEGAAPWLDEENLIPGQDWDRDRTGTVRLQRPLPQPTPYWCAYRRIPQVQRGT
ncbi:MAG: toll/interleukin-1 receptor domain-containing protein [Acidobacteriota bacterium]|nr:toll/interleukin-1 receptor domain-containing protein [Acidobacteriota bacterium]